MKAKIQFRVGGKMDSDNPTEEIHEFEAETPALVLVSHEAWRTGIVVMLRVENDGSVSTQVVRSGPGKA